MSIKVPRADRSTNDWGVVFQSIPARHKNEVVKNLENIFGLEKNDARSILANAPLVFLDDLSFEIAVKIKTFFQKLGVVVDVTNHDIIKKNCSHVSWPQPPVLSFFFEEGNESNAASEQADNKTRASVGTLLARRPPEEPAAPRETQKSRLFSPPTRTTHSFQVTAPLEKPAPLEIDADLEQRAQEMAEKFGRLGEEKRALEALHAETLKTVKNEYQQKLDEEKRINGEISGTVQRLEQEIQKYEGLSRESDVLRSRIATLDEKNRQLETSLEEKVAALELLTREKEALDQKSGRIAADSQRELERWRNRETELLKRIEGLDQTVLQITASLQSRDSALAQSDHRIKEFENTLREKNAAVEHLTQQNKELLRQCENAGIAAQEELERLRSREPELLKTIDGLERTIHQMTETHQQLEKLRIREPELLKKIESLEQDATQSAEVFRAKNERIVHLEKRLPELEGMLKEKTSEVETLTRQKEDLSQQVQKIAALEHAVHQATGSLHTKEEGLVQAERRLLELETILKEKTSVIDLVNRQKDELVRQCEKTSSEYQRELERWRSREPELLKKIEGLEQTVRQVTTSLRTRDGALAQFESRLKELDFALREKTSAIEQLRIQKYELTLQSDRAEKAKQQEVESLRSRELAYVKKIDELERTVQKMKESLRYRDNALAQFEEQVTRLIEMSGSSPKRPPRF